MTIVADDDRFGPDESIANDFACVLTSAEIDRRVSTAATSEGAIESHVSIESHDAEAIVDRSNGKDLAVIQNCHVVDVVDTCWLRKELLLTIVIK